MIKSLSFVLLTSILGSAVAQAETWQGKNLKILPKTITKERIKQQMEQLAEALGVDCDHCHAVPEMDKDTEHKEVAREMMRLVEDVNRKYFGGESKIACMTCHRGRPKPKI